MKDFEYPFDPNNLISRKRKLKKQLLENLPEDALKKRIAVLGGSTTNELVDQLELFLLNYGIKAEFYQSEYGKYWEDALFGNNELDHFGPDVIYIFTNWRNISRFPAPCNSLSEVEEMLEDEYKKFCQMWQAIEQKFQCPIIQNNFERPDYRLLGNMDIYDYRGRSNFLHCLNSKLYDYAASHKGFYINDIEYLSSDYGITAWNDTKYWNLYKYAMPLDAIPSVAKSVACIIKSIYGKNKKLLALDLDNTLWGGIIGEDGVNNIEIGVETASGQIYSEFQTYCKSLKGIGVVLAVNSKNEIGNAVEGLNHPDGILKPDDFVSIKANWEPKSVNMAAISEELSLGMDSFVFVDDSPSERAIVVQLSKGISVVNADSVDDFIRILDHSAYFEVTSLSTEDMSKTEMYHAKAEVYKLQEKYESYDDFLESLDMRAQIGHFDKSNISRIAQLTNKSNQFNLTTLRLSEEEISQMAESNHYICLYGRLIDKFTDNGIVSAVIAEKIQKSLHIRLWLMSCRVLKRDMESVMMNNLMEAAKEAGAEEIIGYYFPTKKNGMVSDFYTQYGFDLLKESPEAKIWAIELKNYVKRKTHITCVKN